MKLKKVLILLLAAALLLSCGCSVQVVEKPKESEPAVSLQETPGPTAEATPEPTSEVTPEPTPEPTPEVTAEPTPEPTPYEFTGYKRGLVSFDEIQYERPDYEALETEIEAIHTMLTDGTDSETIRDAYDQLDEDFYVLSNASSVADLFSAMDVNDTYYSGESEWLAEKSSELVVQATKLEIEIYESEHKDVVFWDWTEEDFEMLRLAEKLYDDEYVQLNTRLEQIRNEYWDAQTNTTFTYNGEEYTIAELDSLDVSEAEYYALMNQCYGNVNAIVAPLYLELVSIEKRIAEKAGYDNYAEFSYFYEYERDYSTEESAAMCEAVKKYAPDLLNELYVGFTEAEYSGLMLALNSRRQISKRMDTIEAYVSEVSPEMKEAYDYLVEYQLSVLTDSDTSQAGAYTTYMPTYDVPFIFLHEAGGYGDVLTFVHEFGHFYASYMGGRDAAFMSSLDVDEICSQANEMLFLPRFRDFYKEDMYRGVVKYQMINMLSALIDGCLYDEFQQYVYSHDIQTVEELNQAYCDISASYGIGEGYYTIDLAYVWDTVHHNFEVPMYYISYATSVVPALEILQLSQTDRQKAIDVYNSVVRADPELSFSEVLADNALASPFEEQTIVDVINAIVDITGVGSHVSLEK